MRPLRRTWNRLLGILPSARRDADLADEIGLHLALQTEDNLRCGMSPAEARRAALLKFGGVEPIKETYRDQRSLPQLETFARDIRYAFRSMRRSPGFTSVAVLSLAFGIGATCALFSVVNATLLRRLPYPEPDRLVTVSLEGAITAPLFDAFRRDARSLSHAALFTNASLNLSGATEPERVPAARVSAELFNLLGVQPRLGRAFTAAEDRPGSGAVAMALLIACVNVASLLIARGLRRRAEIAVRISLGAARARIVRQLLTESLVLALCAAALALPIAAVGIRILIAISPAGVPGIANATLDARVFAFTLAVALVTALLFGTVPALATARRDPVDTLKSGGRGAAGAASRLRPALIIAEFALSLVLLVAATLLAKSFVTVAQTPLGFHEQNVLTMRLSLPPLNYDEHRRAAFIEQLTSRCAALPGVVSAAAVSTLPLTGESEGWGMLADGPDSRDLTVRVRAISPDYFRTLGVRLRAGREFNANDRGEHRVAILSQSAARPRWPALRDPLGRKLNRMIVVGIVDDTRASGLDAEVEPYLYVPFSQFAPEEFAVTLRAAADPGALAAAVKSEIWRLDKNQPITHVEVMRQAAGGRRNVGEQRTEA